MKRRSCLVAALAVVLASCGSNPSPPPSASIPVVAAAPSPSPSSVVIDRGSPTPSPSPSPRADRTPQPTPGPTAGPKPPYRRGAYLMTYTDRLRLRSAPGVGSDSVKYTPLLRGGTDLRVRSGPVEADGYWWYRVHIEDGLELDGGVTVGWLAAADHDGEAWIGPPDTDPIDVEEPGLPEPVLVATGVATEVRDGVTYANYGLSISNWYEYGREYFQQVDVGDCSIQPSRTYVDIYDVDFGYFYSYCWLDRPRELTRLLLAVPEGSAPPRAVYVVMHDWYTGQEATSDVIDLPESPFMSPSP